MRETQRLHIGVYADTQGTIGGDVVFLIDLLPEVLAQGHRVTMLGGRHPELDQVLAKEAPQLLPREVIRMRRPRDTWLLRAPVALKALLRARGGDDDAPFPPALGPTAPLDNGADVEHGLRRILTILASGMLFPGALLRAYLSLRRLRVDVLHVNNGGYPASLNCRAAAIAGRLVRVRVVHWVHNIPAVNRRPESALDRAVISATDVWVTGAKVAADRLLELYPSVSNSQVELVYLGRSNQVSGEKRSLTEWRHPVVALVALIQPRKGHKVLVDAIKIMRAAGNELSVLFVGDGWARNDVERYVHRAGVGDMVQFLGYRTDVADILAGVDVLVHPSLDRELLPYSIKEAMQSGLPVVASDAGGIPELVINGVTGILVPAGDPHALAEALTTVLRDPDLRLRMGSAGRNRIETEFSADQMVTRMISIYQG